MFEQNGSDFTSPTSGWSAAVAGPRMLVEIELAKGQSPQNLALKIPKISHMDISPVASDTTIKTMTDDSESCQHDIVCRANPTPGFTSATKAVAIMLFTIDKGTYLCTGTLLNNSNTPKKFLFWTAAHCISKKSVANTVQAYWF